MKKQRKDVGSRQELFVGIDLHKRNWHVNIRTADAELFSGSIPGNWRALCRLLERYKKYEIEVVYKAGRFGFWLYDRLMGHGVQCIVIPPSSVPQEYGNRVKTDRRDSRKSAHLLARGMLKRVCVPT